MELSLDSFDRLMALLATKVECPHWSSTNRGYVCPIFWRTRGWLGSDRTRLRHSCGEGPLCPHCRRSQENFNGTPSNVRLLNPQRSIGGYLQGPLWAVCRTSVFDRQHRLPLGYWLSTYPRGICFCVMAASIPFWCISLPIRSFKGIVYNHLPRNG